MSQTCEEAKNWTSGYFFMEYGGIGNACRIARLHLLCRLRRGSLPRWVRSSTHLLRNWLAEAKSRLRRDEDWWAMRASPKFLNYA